MTHYMELGFTLESTSVFGLGERLTDFKLKDGSYTLYSSAVNAQKVDDGKGGKQQQGHHPFMMAQLNDGTFIGFLIFNSNAQQVTITSSQQDKTTSIQFISTGGVIDLRFFVGPLYQDVLKQYHSLIGVPGLMPFWAHGFHLQSG